MIGGSQACMRAVRLVHLLSGGHVCVQKRHVLFVCQAVRKIELSFPADDGTAPVSPADLDCLAIAASDGEPWPVAWATSRARVASSLGRCHFRLRLGCTSCGPVHGTYTNDAPHTVATTTTTSTAYLTMVHVRVCITFHPCALRCASFRDLIECCDDSAIPLDLLCGLVATSEICKSNAVAVKNHTFRVKRVRAVLNQDVSLRFRHGLPYLLVTSKARSSAMRGSSFGCFLSRNVRDEQASLGVRHGRYVLATSEKRRATRHLVAPVVGGVANVAWHNLGLVGHDHVIHRVERACTSIDIGCEASEKQQNRQHLRLRVRASCCSPTRARLRDADTYGKEPWDIPAVEPVGHEAECISLADWTSRRWASC